MARAECPIVVVNATTGVPISGASVQIKLRSSGANATWWTAETGGTSSTAAVTTDAAGRVSAWCDRGAYNCVISGTGITTYTEPWDATPAADRAIDPAWVLAALIPSGLVLPFAGSASPDTSLWLICDGSAYSTTTYASLFSAIGYAYGGSGASFNVPDMQGRMPVGKGTHADVNTLGASEGLAVGARRPKHKSSVSDPGHAHTSHVGDANNTGITSNFPNLPVIPHDRVSALFAQFDSFFGTSSVGTGITVGPQTGSEPTDTVPYLVTNYLIKV